MGSANGIHGSPKYNVVLWTSLERSARQVQYRECTYSFSQCNSHERIQRAVRCQKVVLQPGPPTGFLSLACRPFSLFLFRSKRRRLLSGPNMQACFPSL